MKNVKQPMWGLLHKEVSALSLALGLGTNPNSTYPQHPLGRLGIALHLMLYAKLLVAEQKDNTSRTRNPTPSYYGMWQ